MLFKKSDPSLTEAAKHFAILTQRFIKYYDDLNKAIAYFKALKQLQACELTDCQEPIEQEQITRAISNSIYCITLYFKGEQQAHKKLSDNWIDSLTDNANQKLQGRNKHPHTLTEIAELILLN